MAGMIELSPQITEWSPSPVPRTPMARMRGVIWLGNAIIFGFFGILGTWSVFAPLESAAIAAGTVEAETSRKTIQHLEGGIIKEILVQDGDAVSSGQILVRLDRTKVYSERQSWFEQYLDAKAREARLLAERDHLDRIVVPTSLEVAGRSNPSVAAVISGQQKILETRSQVLQSQSAIIRERISQVKEEIAGLQAQENAAAKRADIIREERTAVATLVEKGLERRPRLLSLEREMVEIDGRRGETAAQISRARQVISESQATLLKLESDRQNEIAQSLRETQSQIAVFLEKMRAVEDQLARTDVRAPEDGIVTDLRVHTPGGVIGSGAPLMDLVPKEDRLIVVAHLRPEDIDVVRTGLEAEVHLLPYSVRRVTPLAGRVTYVSADRLTDKRTDQPYYAAKIQINDDSLERDEGIEIIAGMPVQAFIKTGRSTVALYALRPLLDSFHRAFRED
ncbi:type I secretion membrane fusion protein, HlyD family [Microvirga lotononidis]|uniref:Membrane fusion protein (MFP) family protein n=1 Tax=Microvirga lotononidis TaxID=864069 RepID=I4YTE8_9HYPH|nr:type I secretion membrane fusion protein, HlyD family [Microvirga lotononidis]